MHNSVALRRRLGNVHDSNSKRGSYLTFDGVNHSRSKTLTQPLEQQRCQIHPGFAQVIDPAQRLSLPVRCDLKRWNIWGPFLKPKSKVLPESKGLNGRHAGHIFKREPPQFRVQDEKRFHAHLCMEGPICDPSHNCPAAFDQRHGSVSPVEQQTADVLLQTKRHRWCHTIGVAFQGRYDRVRTSKRQHRLLLKSVLHSALKYQKMKFQ